MAEDCGLIRVLGSWVMRQACRQWRQWLAQGLKPGQLSVNVSVSQLQDPAQSVLDDVCNVLAETEMEAQNLCLEITESILMNGSGVLEQLQALNRHGIRLAVDDFGTGYSSLSQLHRFPVHHLKLDRAFITNLDRRPAVQATVRAVLVMAHECGITCVAEGVERLAEWDALQHLANDLYQGYLFSRPLAPEPMEAALRSGRRSWNPDRRDLAPSEVV